MTQYILENLCRKQVSGALVTQIPFPLSTEIIISSTFYCPKKTGLTVSVKISDVIQELLILPKCTAIDVLYGTHHEYVVRSDTHVPVITRNPLNITNDRRSAINTE